jgi:Flp pilus assembly protein TadG
MRKLDNKGNVAILLCLVFTVLLGFTAYVVDIGLIYVEKVKLSNAIDSAVLAASLELPADDIKARNVAIEYLQKNKVDPSKVTITISADKKSIQMVGIKNVNHFFAPIIGISSSNINASTKAIIAPIKAVTGGIRPFAVEVFDFSYGDVVSLKEGAGCGYHGNYGAVALGGRGANVFESNAVYGYSGTITVGDRIDTEPGNMAGATNAIKNYINSECSNFSNFQRNSIRLWTIPLLGLGSLNGNGRYEVSIVGFAEFYVEALTENKKTTEIQGRFVRYVTNGEIDETLSDTGAYGAKLVK